MLPDVSTRRVLDSARVGRVIAVALVVVALAFTACRGREDATDERDESPSTSASVETTSGPCGKAAATPGRSTQTISSGGSERTYELIVPPGDATTPRPVVVNMHGFGSTAGQQLAYTGIQAVAEREGFIVVAPNGAGSPQRFDLFSPVDVDFIGAVLDRLEATACIETERVYAMGMSNGAAMSAVLACRAGDRYAAIAPVAAVVYAAACDAAPHTPIMAFMGTADPVVPFAGGRVNCCGNPTIGAAPDAMKSWAAHNGCDAEPASERAGADVEKRTWSGCDDGADTVFYVIDGGGHTWPGAVPIGRLGKTTTAISATETIWAFFEQHERARASGS